MYYQFALPDGALININGKIYRHIGHGVVANLIEGERPYLIECVKNKASPTEKPVFNNNVLLEPIYPSHTLAHVACRSVAFAATAEEQILRSAA